MKTINILILFMLSFILGAKAQANNTDNEILKRKVSLYFIIKSENSGQLTTRDLLVGVDESDQEILSKEQKKNKTIQM